MCVKLEELESLGMGRHGSAKNRHGFDLLFEQSDTLKRGAFVNAFVVP